MRKYRAKIVLILASVALALYFLYPTYKDYQIRQTLATLSGEDSIKYVESHDTQIREARAKRIKLGLDLQGGMRVVLEVNVVKLLEDLAKNKDDSFNQIITQVHEESHHSDESAVLLLRRAFETRKIALSRYYGSLRDDNDKIYSFLSDESQKAIDRGMEIVRNRVDQYGVSEPTIQKLGGSRIIVELPGVTNEGEVRQLLQGTALLEFKLLKDPDVTYRVVNAIDKAVAATGIVDSTDTSQTAAAQATDTTKIATPEGELNAEEFARKHPFAAIAIINPQQFPGEIKVSEDNRDRVRRILDRDDVKRVIPNDMLFLWAAKPDRHLYADGKRYYTLYPVKTTPELTGGVIVNAKAEMSPATSLPVVTMQMSGEGAREWARITGANIKKRIAVVLDNVVFSAPVVQQKIVGGNSEISGMENLEEARLLEIVLKAGALPAPVDIIEQRSVGPSLGEDSIRSGMLSAFLATALTIFFMAIYYRTGGYVADFALIFCVLFLFAVLAAFQGTLTMPGIAGIILTLGVAVDANVLVYERIREEQASGKTLRAAIDAGYTKAFTAIFDSNLTTFITGIILFQFGTGPVQGFALTLMIGIVVSLFSMFFITHVVFNILTERPTTNVNFG